MCAQGRQPGTFSSYCKSFGVTRDQVHYYMKRHHLRVMDLPGYKWCNGIPQPKEIPFEDIIFEESGFLPADSGKVKVDGRVTVSFPGRYRCCCNSKVRQKDGKRGRGCGGLNKGCGYGCASSRYWCATASEVWLSWSGRGKGIPRLRAMSMCFSPRIARLWRLSNGMVTAFWMQQMVQGRRVPKSINWESLNTY